MTPLDLENFIEREGFNRKMLGTMLGISQDRLRRMFEGTVPIRRNIALACSAIAHGLPPMGDPPLIEQPEPVVKKRKRRPKRKLHPGNNAWGVPEDRPLPPIVAE